MGLIFSILILTGVVAWIGIAALCAYLFALYTKLWKGPEANYHENYTFERPPRVSKSVFNRIKGQHRPVNMPANLDYECNYAVLFEKKLNNEVQYICFPSAILEPGMSPYMLKFKMVDSYKSVTLDLRSNSWVAVKSI